MLASNFTVSMLLAVSAEDSKGIAEIHSKLPEVDQLAAGNKAFGRHGWESFGRLKLPNRDDALYRDSTTEIPVQQTDIPVSTSKSG